MRGGNIAEIRNRRGFLPGLILFLIAPFVGEVLPGARSVLSMLNPFNFIILTTLYGCGAVIIREAAVRWKKGWPTIFLLGLAYGIVEEGIGTQSFANPAWAGLSVPALYGRAFGVNWVWIPQIMLYHSLISMSLSILIVSFLFPDRRGNPYLKIRTVKVCLAAIVLNLALEVFVMFRYNAGPVYYVAAIAAIMVLTGIARKAPASVFTRKKLVLPGPAISVFAFLLSLVYFAYLDSYAPKVAPPSYDLAATFVMAGTALVFLGVVRTRGQTEMLYFASLGAVAYFAFTAVIVDPIDIISSVFFLIIMVAAGFRLRSAHERPITSAG